jgi:hypothetical protein
LVFVYYIVPKGGSVRDALVRANLYTSTVEAARQHVRTVTAPQVAGQTGLEVILLDHNGTEIWRGPYAGSAPDA